MASLASAGIGSGIDIPSLVSSLVDAERSPVTSRLDRQEATLQAQISGYGTLKSALSSFQGSLSELKYSSTFSSVTTSSTDEDVVTASGLSIADRGSYDIEVTQLAKSHSISSTAFAAVDTTDNLSTGTLTFLFGSDADRELGGSAFVAHSSKTAETVTISDADNSLTGIMEAVNKAEIGVTARIVNIGKDAITGKDTFKLLFSSDEAGAENSLKITVSEDVVDGDDSVGLSQFAFDPSVADASQYMAENVKGKDANLKLNGLLITSTTNSVSTAISGTSFELKTLGTASIKVSDDNTKVTEAVTEFTVKFNELVDTFDQLGDYDFDKLEGGALLGDSVLRGIESKIRRLLSSSITDADGNNVSLSSVGVKTNDKGKLVVDSTVLEAAIKKDSTLLGKIFSAQGSTNVSQGKYVTSSTTTKTGSYAVNIEAPASRATLTSTTDISGLFTSGYTPVNGNEFSIKVDGISSETLNLDSAATYNNGTDFAVAIQAAINADSSLKTGGASVLASYDTGSNTLSLLSALYGSKSSIELFDLTDFPALSLPTTQVLGVDVTGTIGGREGNGLGKLLTANGDASGLVMEFASTETGNVGSVAFNSGIASQLDSILTDFLAADSLIESRSQGLTSNVERINTQRTALADKMTVLEARLYKQFNTMDSIVAKLQSTGDYLTQQLESLPGVVKKEQ